MGAAQSAWFAFQGDALLSPAWSIRAELNYRRGDWLARPEQVQPRLSVVYHLNTHALFLVGYQYSADSPYPGSALALATGGPLQAEHRVFEEFSLNHTLVPGHPRGPTLTHRLRVEQRVRAIVSTGAPTADVYSQRVRYLLRSEVPLRPAFRLPALPGYFGVSNEVMVNMGLPGDVRILNQDRASAFIGWSPSPRVTVEAAYIHQYMPLANGIVAEHNDVVQTSLRLSLPLRRGAKRQ